MSATLSFPLSWLLDLDLLWTSCEVFSPLVCHIFASNGPLYGNDYTKACHSSFGCCHRRIDLNHGQQEQNSDWMSRRFFLALLSAYFLPILPRNMPLGWKRFCSEDSSSNFIQIFIESEQELEDSPSQQFSYIFGNNLDSRVYSHQTGLGVAYTY